MKKGTDINTRNKYRQTPLHLAATGGHIEIVRLLLEKGADINARDIKGTPLHWAASRGHLEVVRWLVENGADINARDEDGRTALHWATGNDRSIDVVGFLVEQGAA